MCSALYAFHVCVCRQIYMRIAKESVELNVAKWVVVRMRMHLCMCECARCSQQHIKNILCNCDESILSIVVVAAAVAPIVVVVVFVAANFAKFPSM